MTTTVEYGGSEGRIPALHARAQTSVCRCSRTPSAVEKTAGWHSPRKPRERNRRSPQSALRQATRIAWTLLLVCAALCSPKVLASTPLVHDGVVSGAIQRHLGNCRRRDLNAFGRS